MHKKIEDAAKEYSNNNSEGIGLGHDDDAFKAGAEFALREAIEISEIYLKRSNYQWSDRNYTEYDLINEGMIKGTRNIKRELEQLLSSEDKNAQP